MAHKLKFGALAGVIAAATVTITPANAAEIQGVGSASFASAVHADFARGGAFDSSIYTQGAENTEYRRRWRGYRRYRRGRVRTGDVLAGVLILGGIAAVASAANNNNRRNRDRYEDRRYEDRRDDNQRYDNRQTNPRASGGSGIDSAVSQCLAEIERDVRVENVDGATRIAQGWVVSGTLFNGSGFTCQIDNNGRISNVDYGGFSSSSLGNGVGGNGYAGGDQQHSDSTYANARAAVSGQSYAAADAPQPAYPGGPLPGESFSD